MRILVVLMAVLAVAAVACGGGSGSSGGGGGPSSGGGGGGPSSGGGGGGAGASNDGDGNNCTLVSELAEHEGEAVLFCTEIAGGKYFPEDKRNTVLYVGAEPPGEIARVVLEGAIRASFLTLPEERFGQPGTLICAWGSVSVVDGIPQVFVDNAQEIVFLEELTVTSRSCNGAGTN